MSAALFRRLGGPRHLRPAGALRAWSSPAEPDGGADSDIGQSWARFKKRPRPWQRPPERACRKVQEAGRAAVPNARRLNQLRASVRAADSPARVRQLVLEEVLPEGAVVSRTETQRLDKLVIAATRAVVRLAGLEHALPLLVDVHGALRTMTVEAATPTDEATHPCLSLDAFRFLLSMCVHKKQPAMAGDTIVCMTQDLGLTPDLECFNLAIRACSKNQHGEAALLLFQVLQDTGQRADAKTFAYVLDGCGREGRWVEACKILDLMLRTPEAAASTQSSAHYLIAFTNAMVACVRGNEVDRIWPLFRSLHARGLEPDTIMVNAVMRALGQVGRADLAMVLMEAMQSNSQLTDHGPIAPNPDRLSYGIAMTMTGCGGNVQPVLDLMHAAHAQGVVLGAVEKDIAVRACVAAGNTKAALGVVNDWLGDNDKSTELINATMLVCARMGRWKDALGLLEEMQQDGPPPNMVSFNTVIKALCKFAPEGWDRAEQIVVQMLGNREGPQPDAGTYRILLKGLAVLGKADEAYSLLRHLQRANPENVQAELFDLTIEAAWNSMRLHKHEDLDKHQETKARVLVDAMHEMLSLGLEPAVASMRSALLAAGMLDFGEQYRLRAILQKRFPALFMPGALLLPRPRD